MILFFRGPLKDQNTARGVGDRPVLVWLCSLLVLFIKHKPSIPKVFLTVCGEK